MGPVPSDREKQHEKQARGTVVSWKCDGRSEVRWRREGRRMAGEGVRGGGGADRKLGGWEPQDMRDRGVQSLSRGLEGKGRKNGSERPKQGGRGWSLNEVCAIPGRISAPGILAHSDPRC